MAVSERGVDTAPLPVRWRPRRFDEVIGNDAVVRVLGAAVRSDRPPTQILLAGGSGRGKTTLGRLYAAGLCCEQRDGPSLPCGVCSACEAILTPGKAHPDVVEVDAASAGGKDEILRLASSARLAPVRASWRVWLIDEAHGISKAGVDAFLKLLEEPPPHVCFLLATTEVDRMPATLRGRCLELRVGLPRRDQLELLLRNVTSAEGWPLCDELISLVLDATDPELGVRGVLTTAARLEPLFRNGEKVPVSMAAELLGTLTSEEAASVLDHVADGDPVGALSAVVPLLDRSGEPTVRARLLSASLERMSATAANPEALSRAVRVVELLADAPPGRLGLQTAVVRAAGAVSTQPRGTGHSGSDRSGETQAGSAAETTGAAALSATRRPADQSRLAVAAEWFNDPATATTSPPKPEVRPTKRRSPGGPQTSPGPSPHHARPDPTLRRLIRTLEAKDRAVLSHCDLTAPEPGVLQVVVPASAREEVLRGGFLERVEMAANEVGLPTVRWLRRVEEPPVQRPDRM